MFKLLKKIHLGVERFFDELKKEASWFRALIVWLVLSVFFGFLFEHPSLLAFGLFTFAIPILLLSCAYFFVGRILGGVGRFEEFLYVNSILSGALIFFGVIVGGGVGGIGSLALISYLSVVMVKQLHSTDYLKSFGITILAFFIFLMSAGWLLSFYFLM